MKQKDLAKDRKNTLLTATVFCWVGLFFTSAVLFIYADRIAFLIEELIYEKASRTSNYIAILGAHISLIVYLVWAVGVVLKFMLIIIKNKLIEGGSKVACGVLILIFVSFVGGILILSAPEVEEKYYIEDFERPRYTDEQRDEMIKVNKNLLERKLISEEEYQRRIYEIYGRSLNIPNEDTTSSE